MYIPTQQPYVVHCLILCNTSHLWQTLQNEPQRLWIIYCTIWFCVFEACSAVSPQRVAWASSCSLCCGVGRRAPCTGVIAGMNISSGAIWIPFAQGHIYQVLDVLMLNYSDLLVKFMITETYDDFFCNA